MYQNTKLVIAITIYYKLSENQNLVWECYIQSGKT